MELDSRKTLTSLWNGEEVAQATQGRLAGSFQASNVQIDSRIVEAGDLFIAIRGENNDGHNYLAQVKKREAAGLLVENSKGLTTPYIEVEDGFTALWDLAKAARSRSSAKTTAITGSVGKTGTKELLIAAFSALGDTHGTIGNLNNHFGLPLTLARLPKTAAFSILEMGMSAPEEIRPLSTLGRPQVAIITAIAAAHSEFFSSIKGIALAKSEIFDGIEPHGTAILNRDDDYFEFLKAQLRSRRPDCKLLTFGTGGAADAQLISVDFDAKENVQKVEASIGGKDIRYSLSLNGRHWALNSLAALLAVVAHNEDVERAACSLSTVRPLPGRGEVTSPVLWNEKRFTLVDESYNASPAAVRAAIETLTLLAKTKRKILVLGDMRELGNESRKMHADLASCVAKNNVDLVFTSGSDSQALLEELPSNMRGSHRATAIELLEPIIKEIENGDFVLIKGSLGSNMAPLVKALKER